MMRKIATLATILFTLMFTLGMGKSLTVYAAEYKTINVSASDISSKGAYSAIQAALNEAKEKATADTPYKVVVAGGSYNLTSSLHIYSNTWLYVSGVTFTQKNSENNMITVGVSTDKQSGYCYKNITIEGGTWNENNYKHTAIKAGHASNLTLKNCTVKNVKDAHLVEVAGVNGLTITGCKFQNQTLSTGNSSVDLTYEAVQLDILEESHFTSYTPEDLATKNVTIDNCTFTDVPRGVGSHTAILNNPITNISITNCTFKNCKSCAIQGMSWTNCKIKNNTITGSPRGIALYSVSSNGVFLSSTVAKEGGTTASSSVKYVAPSSSQGIEISGNSITCSGTDPYADYEKVAILVGGYSTSYSDADGTADGGHGDTLPKGDYYISGATISNNTISTTGHGIRLYDTRNSTIDSNTIKYTGSSSSSISYHGIQLRVYSKSNTITNNKITSPQCMGISLYDHSTAKKVSGNTITMSGKGKDGIRAELSSTITTISSNKISQPKENGIYIFNKSKSSTISGNTITKPGTYGINIGKNSKLTTTIKKNTVESAKTHGIFINKSATVEKIESNTLNTPSKDGIRVETSATVTTITKNTITTPKVNGIYIYNKGSVGTISSNTIKSAGKYGIDVEGATVKTIKSNTISKAAVNGIFVYKSGSTATKVTTISSNTIKSPKKYGIGVEKATVTNVTSNTITSAGSHGIFVQKSGKIKSITKNVIKTAKGRGISINSLKCDLEISGNTITECKTDAQIFLNPATTSYTITVKSNKITGTSSTNGIYGTKCKAVISSNTIKSSNKAILLSTSVKGSVKGNKMSGNKSNALTYGSKTIKGDKKLG